METDTKIRTLKEIPCHSKCSGATGSMQAAAATITCATHILLSPHTHYNAQLHMLYNKLTKQGNEKPHISSMLKIKKRSVSGLNRRMQLFQKTSGPSSSADHCQQCCSYIQWELPHTHSVLNTYTTQLSTTASSVVYTYSRTYHTQCPQQIHQTTVNNCQQCCSYIQWELPHTHSVLNTYTTQLSTTASSVVYTYSRTYHTQCPQQIHQTTVNNCQQCCSYIQWELPHTVSSTHIPHNCQQLPAALFIHTVGVTTHTVSSTHTRHNCQQLPAVLFKHTVSSIHAQHMHHTVNNCQQCCSYIQ